MLDIFRRIFLFFMRLYTSYKNRPRVLSYDTFSRSRKLRFSLDGKDYIIVWPRKVGPRKWYKAVLHNGEDITPFVKAYAGPDDNFFGKTIAPQDMGLSEITIVKQDKTRHMYLSEESILL